MCTRQATRRELTPDEVQEIREAFNLFDSDRDGSLDYYELKVALLALGFEVPKTELTRMMKDHGDKDGKLISLAAFDTIASAKVLGRDPVDEVRKAFKLFDDDNTGKVTVANLKRVAQELGEVLDEKELQAMIDEFDVDNDGGINEQEFINIMTDGQ
ncbi:Calcium-binding component of the spindle pole body (SPB) half-bridge [Dimargaris verticillata]|uniref:Calcium-binding component of the spindle pole body (SPB) half-bridge n=1 Tax=Dimargaris verticillata TaxID=2761393 RepID=A0A9W8B9F1_9FUNG|nr:Calcium-binding component of the spindle pole body (SPB) half-bridge [Dimargaris verticillata]